MLRKFFSATAVLVSTITLLLTALPQQVTYACLPCACPTNTSINCYGDYALYTKTLKNGTCDIEVVGINPKTGKPRKALYVKASTLAKLPDNPEQSSTTAASTFGHTSCFDCTIAALPASVREMVFCRWSAVASKRVR